MEKGVAGTNDEENDVVIFPRGISGLIPFFLQCTALILMDTCRHWLHPWEFLLISSLLLQRLDAIL
jgi:hypothetical protein